MMLTVKLMGHLFIDLTPCMHPKKSLIFQGTRCIPLSFKGEGEGYKKRGEASLGLSILWGV